LGIRGIFSAGLLSGKVFQGGGGGGVAWTGDPAGWGRFGLPGAVGSLPSQLGVLDKLLPTSVGNFFDRSSERCRHMAGQHTGGPLGVAPDLTDKPGVFGAQTKGIWDLAPLGGPPAGLSISGDETVGFWLPHGSPPLFRNSAGRPICLRRCGGTGRLV